ncbi:T9SS type A sorting domain-containing protein [Salibacteraceae bacterium]|nr:T9SS type A sorting domain-containing protein [Salibacteraceae bacterium]
MKQLLLLFSALLYVIVSQAQITAYRPDGAFYSWWSQDWVLDEVGTGMVDSLEVDIDIKGQMATVNYRFYLRALPDAENINEDNDSLELRAHFTTPDNVIFTEMKMWMNSELRVGRIIERSKADIIYENLVYNPNIPRTPKDPGYLSKNGNEYEFRAFPVGADELAYLELTSVIELESSNSLTKEALVSLDLFAQTQEDIKRVEITYSISDDFQNALPSGLGFSWVEVSPGNYHAEAFEYDLNSDLNFVLLNEEPHLVNYSHTGVSNDETHLWTLPSAGIGEELSCKYLILLDIDFNNLPSGDDYETFIVDKVESALDGISKIMTENDYFKFSTSHEYMLDYSDDWISYSPAQFQSVSYWVFSNMGSKADIVSATTHAQSLTLGENAHTIILTNDYFDADLYTPADLEVLAETILSHNSGTHTDIYSLNQVPESEIVSIGKRKIEVHQTFFTEYTSRLNGVYSSVVGRTDVQVEEAMKQSILSLENISTGVLPNAQNYFRFNEAGQLSLYSNEAYVQSPELLSFEYSNGQQLQLSVGSPYKAQVDSNLRKLMGTAHMFTALNSSDRNSYLSRDYEEISLEYGLVTDYSALLVVEHDSQYNDTDQIFTDEWWPQPLSAEEVLFNEIEETIEVYPNPASESFIVKSTSDIQTIQLQDIVGRVVYSKDVNSISRIVEVSDLYDLPRGTYVLSVLLANGSIENTKLILN